LRSESWIALRSIQATKLIHLIRERRPTSINKLATIARRDFKGVYEDVRSLAEAGLVNLDKDGGRQKVARVELPGDESPGYTTTPHKWG